MPKGRPVGCRNRTKTDGTGPCTRCGAIPSSQHHKPRRNTTDLNAVKVIENMHPSDAVQCPRCKVAFYCVKLEADDCYIVSDFEGEMIPNYCPMCGRDLRGDAS